MGIFGTNGGKRIKNTLPSVAFSLKWHTFFQENNCELF